MSSDMSVQFSAHRHANIGCLTQLGTGAHWAQRGGRTMRRICARLASIIFSKASMLTFQTAVTLLIISTVLGCATREEYRRRVKSWIGSHSDRLVGSWGAPSNYYQNSDGSKILTYEKNRTYTTGGYTSTKQQYIPSKRDMYGNVISMFRFEAYLPML